MHQYVEDVTALIKITIFCGKVRRRRLGLTEFFHRKIRDRIVRREVRFLSKIASAIANCVIILLTAAEISEFRD